jgi:hypothetical protein
MHQLTINDDRAAVSITGHPSFADAHRALLKYVVGADYYLQLVHRTAAHISYRLLRLPDPDDPRPVRRPHLVGIATIEELPDTGKADQRSAEALRRNAIPNGSEGPPALAATVGQPTPADSSDQRPPRWPRTAPRLNGE